MKFFVREGVLVLILLFLATGLGFGQNTAEQILTKGIEYGAQGKFKEAKEEFEKALKVDPSFKTVERFLKLIEDVNQQKKKSKTAISYFKGVACQLKRRWDEAIDEYNKAIEINHEYACAYNARGHAYYRKGQYDKAISDYTKAIELNSRYAYAYKNRGFVYMLRLGNKIKACSDWKWACGLGSCEDYKLAKRKGDCK